MASLLLGVGTNVQAAVSAADYYQLRCADCHGSNGQGTEGLSPSLAPALRDNPLVMNAPSSVIVDIIRHGRSGQQRVYDKYPNMPMFGPVMVPDAEGLVEYLKTDLQQSP